MSIVNIKGQQVGRRVKRFLVDPEIFPMLFLNGNVLEVIDGIPGGSIFRGYVIDPANNCCVAFIENPEFEMIPFNGMPPQVVMKVRAIDNVKT